MVHRSVTFAYAICLVIGAMQAFIALQTFDEIGVLGPTSQVWIRESDGTSSGEDVVGTIRAFSEEHAIDVVKEIPDPVDPVGTRVLFVSAGGEAGGPSRWLAEEAYPGFSAQITTVVKPVGELASSDPRGYYWIFGDESSAVQLLNELRGLGLDGIAADYPGLAELPRFVAYGAMLWGAIVAALLVVVLVGSGVLMSSRYYAIQRLQGASFRGVLLRDLRQVAVVVGLTASVLFVASLAALSLYNGLSQYSNYALVAGATVGMLVAVAAATHLVALAVVWQTPLASAIKGEIPAGSSLAAALAVRAAALIIAATLIASAAHTSEELSQRWAAQASFTAAGESAYPMLSGSVVQNSGDLSDQNARDAAMGELIRESDRAGDLILSAVSSGSELNLHDPELATAPVLIVNAAYIEARSRAGDEIPPTEQPAAADDGVVHILVPDRLAVHTAELQSGVDQWVAFAAENGGTRAQSDVSTLASSAEHRAFTYGAPLDPSSPVLLVDPIYVVLPPGLLVLPDSSLVAYSTSGGVIFTDPEATLGKASARGLDDYLIAMNPIAENADSQLRKLAQEARLQYLNLAGLLLVLLVTAVGAGFIYTRKNAQALFVKYISGRSFIASHRSMLIAEGAVALLVGGWVVFRAAQEADATSALTASLRTEAVFSGGGDVALAVGVILLNAAAAVASLSVLHRRLIRTRSADA
jgi:hypothetical protein